MYRENYPKARFHIQFGPPSLFERVHFKMRDAHKLYLDGTHYKKRLSERDIPTEVLEALLDFDASTWNLQTAEVRTDRGKFVNSTWEKVIDGHHYWVTIGIGNYVKTIVDRTTSGMEKCIRSGELYDLVEHVNVELMTAEQALNCTLQRNSELPNETTLPNETWE